MFLSNQELTNAPPPRGGSGTSQVSEGFFNNKVFFKMVCWCFAAAAWPALSTLQRNNRREKTHSLSFLSFVFLFHFISISSTTLILSTRILFHSFIFSLSSLFYPLFLISFFLSLSLFHLFSFLSFSVSTCLCHSLFYPLFFLSFLLFCSSML